MRAAADRNAVSIAGHEPHRLDRYAQPFADQLRETGLVTLAVRHSADDDFHDAFRQYGDFSPLARGSGRGVHVIGDTDAAVFAASPGLRSPRREPRPVAERDDTLHDPVVGAAVVDHAERVAVRHRRSGTRLRRRNSSRSKPICRAARSISLSMTNMTSGRPELR